jgi:methylmalonyl-CoA carboxyltransferase large subunit
MTTTPSEVARLVDVVEELQRRIAKLEKQLAEASEQPRGPVPIDTILAISAAVAAYLGKKATVRQIHYSHTNSWARMGRSNIHASHTFTHTRSH